MMTRAIALIVVIGLAACERPTAPPVRARSATPASLPDNTDPADATVKQNVKLDLSGTVVSPCTGEPIAFQGSAHIVATYTPTADGFTVETHFNTQGVSGVGTVSGTNYQIIQSSNEDDEIVASDPATESGSVDLHYRVISNGSTDNFLADFIFTFTYPPPTATYKVENVRCEG